jgi:t-SNARE complex subunit (syntaxin)
VALFFPFGLQQDLNIFCNTTKINYFIIFIIIIIIFVVVIVVVVGGGGV